MEKLHLLAEKLGIATEFCDAGMTRCKYKADDNILKFFAWQFGCHTCTEDEVTESLRQLEEKRWHRAVEAVYVCNENNIGFDLSVPSGFEEEYIDVAFKAQEGKKSFDVSYDVIDNGESRIIGKERLNRLQINITSPLPIGYYNVEIKIGHSKYRTVVAVAPKTCYENPALEKGRLWGFSIQLYALQSEHNWGVGDFSDLYDFVGICKNCGANAIGLNPLNVLQHNFPEEASPYASISRLFLNPIYIDVSSVPEFSLEDILPYNTELEDIRKQKQIAYGRVYPLKIKVLEKLYQRFLAYGTPQRRKDFEKFCKEKGQDLDCLCAFQALSEVKSQGKWSSWRSWEEEYKNVYSPEIEEFCEEHAERINFFKFLQFEAERQFARAAKRCEELGLAIGFYRDLAVGVGQDSAEVWSRPELFFENAGAGAPPDAFFPAGQKWGLGAFNPQSLKDDAYQAFIKILRANMSHAGALRIDHVMGLLRLYIIPDDKEVGTYIYYNLEDMLNLVALESQLQKCIVVGESIGNVPDGFLDSLYQKRIYSLSVLWSERYDSGWGDFMPPEAFAPYAFASVGTHDMAPLKMWWFGYDIELSHALGLIKSEQEKQGAYKKRENDRWKLLCALDKSGVWPEDRPRSGNFLYGEGYPEGIDEAVHRYMAKSASSVFLAQLEDILQVDKMQNLPGTDRDKHPNWRLKLPEKIERLESLEAFSRNVAAIRKER